MGKSRFRRSESDGGEHGPSTTIYNRFNRWSRRRFRIKFLEALAASGAVTRSTAVDSTYAKAQRSAFGGKRGPKTQAIGPSRGGQTTKVHALTDTVGRPFALILTPSDVSDITLAPALLARASGARYVLADKSPPSGRRSRSRWGYDADALRRTLRQAGAGGQAGGQLPVRRRPRHPPGVPAVNKSGA